MSEKSSAFSLTRSKEACPLLSREKEDEGWSKLEMAIRHPDRAEQAVRVPSLGSGERAPGWRDTCVSKLQARMKPWVNVSKDGGDKDQDTASGLHI